MYSKNHTTLVLAFKTEQKCSWTFHVLKYQFFSKTTIRNTQNQEMQTSLELDIVQHGQRCWGNPASCLQVISFEMWAGKEIWVEVMPRTIIKMTVIMSSAVFVFDEQHFIDHGAALNTSINIPCVTPFLYRLPLIIYWISFVRARVRTNYTNVLSHSQDNMLGISHCGPFIQPTASLLSNMHTPLQRPICHQKWR